MKSGGVIAYPTEGVFGLGCLPGNSDAVRRVLEIKQRDASKGLILIAATPEHFDGWIDDSGGLSIPAVDASRPITWIVPAGPKASALIRGEHSGIAVRITSNPVAKAISAAVDGPLVSTSANLSGEDVAGDQAELRRQFGTLVDYVVPGDCGPARGPSEIRMLSTGEVLRPTTD